ncbi:MAG: hypothetical protein AB7N61_24670, partial [Acidimicrobiia bacterium]
DSDRAIGVFSFRWVLAEHTKDHADGSPAGGPTNPHHATGLYPALWHGSQRNSVPLWRAAARLRR